MVSRWARPATVLNSYSLLTGLRQRAVNAGCMFAAFIFYNPSLSLSMTSCTWNLLQKNANISNTMQEFECKIWKEVGEEVIRFHSRRQFNCS